MKKEFWELVKDLTTREFEIVGKTKDDIDFSKDIVKIQKATERSVACETPDISTTLQDIRNGMIRLGLKESPGLYRNLRKEANLTSY